MAYEIPKDKLYDGVNRIVATVKPSICEIDSINLFYWFFVPIIIILILILIWKFKETIKFLIVSRLAKRGYIRIKYIMPNKRIIEKLKKLDKFNTFKFKKKRYVLEKMHDYIIGYDKYGIPIFMYDNNFIIPLKISKKAIDEQLKQSLKDSDIEVTDDLISEFSLKIEPSIFQIVYDKKLISDLYSLSTGDDIKKMLIWVFGGIILLIFLYYTGLLAKILEFVGVKI